MVLFTNIKINQRVEVFRGDGIDVGTVKFVGAINGVPGEWVGVSFDKPVGRHEGMLGGRRYFHCLPSHGIFAQAENIRFIPMKRRSYASYSAVYPESVVEEDLFTSWKKAPDVQDDALKQHPVISEGYLHNARVCFLNRYDDLVTQKQTLHHLNHSVGNSVSAVTMLRPQTSRAKITRVDYPIYYDIEAEEFVSRPTIPQCHKPRSRQKYVAAVQS